MRSSPRCRPPRSPRRSSSTGREMRRRLALLGATGSIAESTLDIVARHRDRFDVASVAANHSVDKLLDVCRRFRPEFAAMLDPAAAHTLAAAVAAEDLPTR